VPHTIDRNDARPAISRPHRSASSSLRVIRPISAGVAVPIFALMSAGVAIAGIAAWDPRRATRWRSGSSPGDRVAEVGHGDVGAEAALPTARHVISDPGSRWLKPTPR
jgi:hypothetical protein